LLGGRPVVIMQMENLRGGWHVTRVILDSGTAASWRFTETTEVCDESGRTLGFFHPVAGKDAAAVSPFSREELERFRGQRTGRPLEDVLRDLQTP
jgi:hypothetical protein